MGKRPFVLTHSCLCPSSCRGCRSHRTRPTPWMWWSSLPSTAWASSPRTSSSMPGPSAVSLVTSLPPPPPTVGTFKPSLCPPRRGGEMHWWPRSGVEASRRRGGTGVGSLSASGRSSPFSRTLHISFHPCARLFTLETNTAL